LEDWRQNRTENTMPAAQGNKNMLSGERKIFSLKENLSFSRLLKVKRSKAYVSLYRGKSRCHAKKLGGINCNFKKKHSAQILDSAT